MLLNQNKKNDMYTPVSLKFFPIIKWNFPGYPSDGPTFINAMASEFLSFYW